MLTQKKAGIEARNITREKQQYFQPKSAFLLEAKSHQNQSFYWIREGVIKIVNYTNEGEEITLEILKKGELFWDFKEKNIWAITLESTRISEISLEEIKKQLNQPAARCEALHTEEDIRPLWNLIERRYQQVIRQLEQNRKAPKQKMIDNLLMIAALSSPPLNSPIVLPPWTQKELQGLTGLTIQTISKTLSELKTQGLIQGTRGKLQIPCLTSLLKSLNYN